MSDFADERVQRIADVTFNETDGEGAAAEWWDMLASIDADLATSARHDEAIRTALDLLAGWARPMPDDDRAPLIERVLTETLAAAL